MATEKSLTLQQLPSAWLIHIFQFLEENDLFHLEKTCKHIRKSAIDPNALPKIECTEDTLNQYTQNARYDGVQQLLIAIELRNQRYGPAKDDQILSSINTFPNLNKIMIYASRLPFNITSNSKSIINSIFIELYKILSTMRVRKIDLVLQGHCCGKLVHFFDRNSNLFAPKMLSNLNSLSFDVGAWYGEKIKETNAFISYMVDTLESMELSHPKIETIKGELDININDFKEYQWSLLKKLAKYCHAITLSIFPDYSDGEMSELLYQSHVGKFVEELLKQNILHTLDIDISICYRVISDSPVIDFKNNFKPWLQISRQSMQRIGLTQLKLGILYEFDFEKALGIDDFYCDDDKEKVKRKMNKEILPQIKSFCKEHDEVQYEIEYQETFEVYQASAKLKYMIIL